MDIERQKENFKNHVATLTDCGNIKILDFKNPESDEYRIRFLFEEDYCKCHITGDLGSLIATNRSNMTFERFNDFVNSAGYFSEKIDCMDREKYHYDAVTAEKELSEKLQEIIDNGECNFDVADVVWVMMHDFGDNGFGSKAQDILSEYDSDCWEYIGDLGKERDEILDLYLLAFKLATEQLAAQSKA